MRTQVEQWDTFEMALDAKGTYENPFVDVALSARFVHEETGRGIEVDGFYDGDSTWRVRFMPDEPGTWRFETSSDDKGLNAEAGSISCIGPLKPYLHGPLRCEGLHFRHADGTRRYLVSTRLSCHFASPGLWPPIFDHLTKNRIERVFFMMGGKYGTIRQLYSVDGERIDFSRYNIAKFRAIDNFVDALRREDILAGPYFYYCNDGDQAKMTLEEDKAFIRYGMARFGAYCNVMPCLANQLEKKYNEGGPARMSYDNRSQAWGNALGAYLKSRAVFGVPVTVHNPLESFTAVNPSFYTLLRDWPFPWADYMLRQIQVGALGGVSELSDDVPEKGRPGIARGAGEAVFPRFFNPRSFAHQNQLMIDLRRFGIPVVNEEPGYEKKATPGSYTGIDPKSWNFQTSESLLSTFWTAALAGGYNMWGSLETYSLDDPLPGLQNSVTPQYIRILHDFMTRLPYWEMAPANEVVSPFEIEIEGKPWRSNFCMAKAAEIYVVFSEYGGEGTMSLPQGSYRVTRLNPRIGLETDLGAASGGKQPFKLPLGEWVLLYRREA